MENAEMLIVLIQRSVIVHNALRSIWVTSQQKLNM
jgi:hypothetical protein